VTKEEQLRIHLLGALRLEECPDTDDREALSAFLADQVAMQVEGIGWIPDRRPGWWVNVYAVERHYGGPEEGGWYYNAGTPVASFECETEEEAGKVKEKAEKEYSPQAHGNIYSVRGGVAIQVDVENLKGLPFPAHQPHYE